MTFSPIPTVAVAVMVGDVCGKGNAAALLMMGPSSTRTSLAAEPNPPAVVVDRLNRVLAAAALNTRFISFFFALLHPVSGELVYSNAGHNPPLLIRANGTVEWLTKVDPCSALCRTLLTKRSVAI
jgi:sigma-B regulation protein RsbU (phosphoserine phosphatase)